LPARKEQNQTGARFIFAWKCLVEFGSNSTVAADWEAFQKRIAEG